MTRPLRLLLAWLAASAAGAALVARFMAYGLGGPGTRERDDEEQRRALEEWARDHPRRRRPDGP
jgi:myo-inositol-1-phosphate synthase